MNSPSELPPFSSTARLLIYRQIRREIIMGRRKAGERLNVEGLALRFATSITPVRDALQMLQNEELVTIRPRSGIFVASITLKQLRDMLDLRKTLELAAVERAALRIAEDQIARLRAVHAGYTGDDDESYDRYTDENRRFHYLVAVASGNMELAELVGRLHDRLARFMVARRAGKSQVITHANIVNALEAHHIERSRRAMLEDIDPSSDAILDAILENVSASWRIDSF
ncbi:MAG: GntR family transcriptional regulator [Chloroflexi bacterium]|nr:GntR family transcriptional regulator [Chloroflexota bacterium]